ncbi:MAG: hypothetical protein QOE48_120 [Mycobacterium sp.]|nr:hypothetical protein [Mycobacterium sp.]
MSKHNPIRSAIIGAGMVGSVHAYAVHRAGGQLAAISASTPHSSELAAQRLGAERAATSEDIFAADDVDVVHICTPNNLHLEQAAAALAAGKHVICEKPLATTVADAQALVDAAHTAGTVAAVSFIYRFYPMAREARHRIADSAVWLMHGGYVQDHQAKADPTGWRSDPAQSGVSMTFADIGSHWCDLAEFVTGHRITAVFAAEAAAPRGSIRQDDGAVVAFRTDRGAIGSVVVSQSSPGGLTNSSSAGSHPPRFCCVTQPSSTRVRRATRFCLPGIRRDTRTVSTRSSPTSTTPSVPAPHPTVCRSLATDCGQQRFTPPLPPR